MSDPAPTIDPATSPADKNAGPNPHGSFIWYELLTTDPDAAADFYGKVVGWTTRDSGQENIDYRVLSAPDADIGGVMQLSEGMPPPTWLGYIGVDDVDVAVARIQQAGGAVHMPPTDIPNVGRFAMLADPQGAVFYVMRGTHPGASTAFLPMAAGHCRWNELVTSDQAAALDFYIDQFGWEKGDIMPMGEAGDYRFLHHHGQMFGAVMNRMDATQPPVWNYYFGVPSIAVAVDTIHVNGGTVTFGPQEVPGGDHVVSAVDPQGAIFGLVGPAK